MRFRWLNRLKAWWGCYFWLPCPLCGQHFGGHEWRVGHTIPTERTYVGKGVCPDCGEQLKRARSSPADR